MLIGNNIALVVFGLKFGGALEIGLSNFFENAYLQKINISVYYYHLNFTLKLNTKLTQIKHKRI